jgi:tetratricopeptide (TPR) repeat protein
VLREALASNELMPREAARLHWLGARLAARQGRLGEALEQLERARALVGSQPALARTRGDAYQAVWHWQDAALAYQRAAEGAPADDSTWVLLAQAHGSAGHPDRALTAALRGLRVQPRSEALLRSQALGMKHLNFPHEDLERAFTSHFAHRAPPQGPAVRGLCLEKSARCALEQVPIHTHWLLEQGD